MYFRNQLFPMRIAWYLYISCVMVFILPGICLQEIGLQNGQSVINSSFLRVVLSPDFLSDPNSEQDLRIILEVISTRFTRIVTFPPIGGTLQREVSIENQSFTYIPRTAAMLNRMKALPKLDVTITFYMSENRTALENNFVHAWNQASEANKEYPGTVSTLLLYVDNPKQEGIVRTVMSVVDIYKKLLNSEPQVPSSIASQPVKVGFWLILQDCAIVPPVFQFYKDPLSILSRYVDIIVIDNQPNSAQFAAGPNFASKQIIERFLKCESRIRPYYTSNRTDFILSTGWISPKDIHLQEASFTDQNLVTYWKLMGNWSAHEKRQVIIQAAFDNPLEEDGSIGWWRLRKKDGVNITKSAFVEKVYDVEPTTTTAPQIVSVLSSTAIVVILSVAIVAVPLIMGLIFLMYKLMRKAYQRQQLLTQAEYQQFRYGGKEINPVADGKVLEGRISCNLDMLSLPYNKELLELSKSSLSIDHTAVLGMGAFGCVYKGRVKGIEKDVAFKTTRPFFPIQTLKGLLSEIKVLSYIGKHDHVLGLVGVYTAELKQGVVYVVTELCEVGSLEKYLRRLQKQPRESCLPYLNVNERTSLLSTSTFDRQSQMLRWSFEIVSGMEYIASKNVVHADLAARNILLTSELTVKIADFGLSRRLYDYTNYVKKQQEPLPWKWMSIEALKNMEFSEKSDVWAFGCTMWEIYSLGDVLYAGLSWSPDFVDKLQEGLRLSRPKYASQEIYDFMIQCWHPVLKERITFTSLKDAFVQLIDTSYLRLETT